jgi:O-Antigen ligase
MSISVSENVSSRIISIGLAVVTIAVFTETVTDPVNVTKLFLLGGFAFASFAAAWRSFNREFFQSHKIAILALGFFSLAAISALISSKSPFAQSLYGVYGRNNGYLLYFLLTLTFLAALTISNEGFAKRPLIALAIAGTTNVAYALWVLAFGDFIGWNNPYGALLGTLGNPNFIGSFFGMFAAMLFAYLLAPSVSKRLRFCALTVIPLVAIGIVQSHAVQGKVLFITGFAISSFYWVRDRFEKLYFSVGYLLLLGACFVTALFGTLQKGPLASILYKETVSLRGEYWHAGWKAGLSHPYFGVGFDSLGDWYRRTRRSSALKLPGVDTITNAAHNVFMDIFAFGGWPLLIGYVAIVVAVLISILRFTRRNRQFDPIFVSLTGVWVCYQLQSTISINQIGLAIWGWAIGGALIAYELNDSKKRAKVGIPENKNVRGRNRRKNQNTSNIISPGLVAGLASVLGLLVAVPPLSADANWRSAQNSQSTSPLELSLQPSYLNPLNTYRFANIVGVFETNGFTDLAHSYALKAVAFDKDSFECWRNLYQLSKSTDEERALALANMKRLDPLNPNVGAIKK